VPIDRTLISRASSGDGGARDLGGSSASGSRWKRGVDRAVLKYEGVEGSVLDSPEICIVWAVGNLAIGKRLLAIECRH
jgi:hypothetical protein